MAPVAKIVAKTKIDPIEAALRRIASGDTAAITDAVLRGLVQRADDAMARERVSVNDNATDKLFALLMARIDALQAQRGAYLVILDYIRTHPQKLRVVAPLLAASMEEAIAQAGLDVGGPRGKIQATGLLAVYMWTLRAWQKDTQADMPATMRALDQGLRRAAQAATWLGL